MTIGLLLCDHIHESFLHVHGDYPAMYMDFLPDYEFIVYDLTEEQYPGSVSECSVWMVSGSRYSVYDDIIWIHWLKAFVQQIRESDSKYIGICFGHQMMGHALGGIVQKSENGWCVGVHRFDIIDENVKLNNNKRAFNILMMCQDQITSLPENTELLAMSARCPNAMILTGHNMLGIQGHPEYSKDYVEDLMLSRVDRMGADVVNDGVESLQLSVDTETIRSLVIQFIEK